MKLPQSMVILRPRGRGKKKKGNPRVTSLFETGRKEREENRAASRHEEIESSSRSTLTTGEKKEKKAGEASIHNRRGKKKGKAKNLSLLGWQKSPSPVFLCQRGKGEARDFRK